MELTVEKIKETRICSPVEISQFYKNSPQNFKQERFRQINTSCVNYFLDFCSTLLYVLLTFLFLKKNMRCDCSLDNDFCEHSFETEDFMVKVVVLILSLLVSAVSMANTYSCDVEKCTSIGPDEVCPANLYVLTEADEIVFNFQREGRESVKVSYPGLTAVKTNNELYISDESDALLKATDTSSNKVYKGLFKTYETLKTYSRIPIEAYVLCSQVN